MSPFRRLLACRHIAVLICAAALAVKLLVPAGYMIGSDHGRIAITICSGIAHEPMTMAMPGMARAMQGHGRSTDHGRGEMPCAFSALSAAVTGAIDPIQLASAIAFVMAIALVGVWLPTPAGPRYLRPPLRGPPAHP